MKALAAAGIALVVLGLVALVYQGITYTSRESVLDVGPIHATTEQQKTIPLPPMVGLAAIGGGVVLLIAAVGKSAYS
jgi:hypothetical protein